jgi:methyl-accepting chemotaxis protein/methyl-accepting chemotaxis protein-1 (serine sensor receptor)
LGAAVEENRTMKKTIAFKLTISSAASLLLMIGLGVASVISTRSLESTIKTAYDRDGAKLSLSGDIASAAMEMAAQEEAGVSSALQQNAQAYAQHTREFQAAANTVNQSIARLRSIVESEGERNSLGAFESSFNAWIPLHDQIARSIQANDFTTAIQIQNERLKSIEKNAVAAVQRFKSEVAKTTESRQVNAQSVAAWSNSIALILSAMAVIAGLGSFAVIRQTNRALRASVTELSDAAVQISGAAGQVASASQTLAQGTSQQAATLEESSASGEEINAMARQNSDHCRSAAELMHQAQEKLDQTGVALAQMVTAMGDINSSSEKIGKIIKVIDEIAFQTNILALNAAVEAARAGEAGMGFAVVADEVRNLAQRCSQAAKDTSALIEESIAKAGEGKVKVDHVAVAIRALSEHSANAKTMVDQVRSGSDEQARGIDQIARAIVQMEQVTQASAANAEESAAAAQQLNAQSGALQQVVTRLEELVGSAGGRTGRRSA